MKQIALIGPTASGKTSLSLELADKLNANILSLDSLSIYKQIDIVSAKPAQTELNFVPHYGIDIIYPDEPFDVTIYGNLYRDVYKKCQDQGKNLVIVGGTSFYLKSLVDGISSLPKFSQQTKKRTEQSLLNLKNSYNLLYKIDNQYMQNIEATDRYRLEKLLNIYHETNQAPTEYFQSNKPIPIIQGQIDIYQIDTQKEQLRTNIKIRTKQMIDDGAIDEVSTLERQYTREPNCMKAIGIKETLDYLDGVYTKDILIDKISTNTYRLAKRQMTFNASQFTSKYSGTAKQISQHILS